MSNQAFSHQPGTAIECLSIPITLHKEENKCGFKIGGGIDQDYRKSPQGCEKTWPIQKFLTRENIVLLDQLHLARFGTRVTRITVMIRELKYLHIEVCIPLYVRMGHCNVHVYDGDDEDDG